MFYLIIVNKILHTVTFGWNDSTTQFLYTETENNLFTKIFNLTLNELVKYEKLQ